MTGLLSRVSWAACGRVRAEVPPAAGDCLQVYRWAAGACGICNAYVSRMLPWSRLCSAQKSEVIQPLVCCAGWVAVLASGPGWVQAMSVLQACLACVAGLVDWVATGRMQLKHWTTVCSCTRTHLRLLVTERPCSAAGLSASTRRTRVCWQDSRTGKCDNQTLCTGSIRTTAYCTVHFRIEL